MTVKSGTNVTYHGSLTEFHGPAVVAGSIPEHGVTGPNKSVDGMRYVLIAQEERLSNVRRQSFTVPEENAVPDVLAQVKDVLDDLFDPWKADRAPGNTPVEL